MSFALMITPHSTPQSTVGPNVALYILEYGAEKDGTVMYPRRPNRLPYALVALPQF